MTMPEDPKRQEGEEASSLRLQVAMLREALEDMLEATGPDSTVGEVFDAQDRARTVLARIPTSG